MLRLSLMMQHQPQETQRARAQTIDNLHVFLIQRTQTLTQMRKQSTKLTSARNTQPTNQPTIQPTNFATQTYKLNHAHLRPCPCSLQRRRLDRPSVVSVCCLLGCSCLCVDWLVGWLVGWLVAFGWLVCSLVGWLTWLVVC